MDSSQKCTAGRRIFFFCLGNHDFFFFPGNMQQWQVNQREHLFTSQWRERELDGLLCMQTQAAQGKHLFIPSWMRSSPRRRRRSLRGVELRTHARRSETNTKTLFIGELLHAPPCCKANNCDHCLCPALDVNKRITGRVTFPGHDTMKGLKIYVQREIGTTGLNGQDGGLTRVYKETRTMVNSAIFKYGSLHF